MPIEDDEAAEKGGNYTISKLYKPWPDAAGTSFDNEVFVPLCAPAEWAMFNQTQESAARLGASLSNPLRVEGLPELYTFYFKIPTHSVQKYQRDNGSVGFANIMCPIKFNYFLEKHINRKPLFIKPRCPFCEAQAEAWAEHNARWEQLGIDKKTLSKEGYLSTVKGDRVLTETKKRAYDLNVVEKNILNVFDHSKFIGDRPTAEGEALGYQTWFAPKVVLTALIAADKSFRKHNVHSFYDFGNPAGLHILNVTKNTERCSAGDFRDTA